MTRKRCNLEEKILQRINDSRESCHHIINKRSKELFCNLHDKDNFKNWTRWPHRKRHEVHHNEHPQETLQNCNWFTQVMSPKAKEIYEVLCSMSLEEFYNKRFIK